MESKQAHKLVQLAREHFRLLAEIKSLAAILETAERLNQAPIKWLDALKLLRTQPEYRNISEQFEPQLAEVERSAEAIELGRLLDSIPPAQFLN